VRLPVKKWPDSVLLTACKDWDFANPPLNSTQLEQDLIDTMLAEQGIGLAANQVGIGYRVIAQQFVGNGQVVVMYNPRLISASDELWQHPEGCLSFPGVSLDIARSQEVTALWHDRNGEEETRVLTDMDAKCFLHELEHLEGRVFKEHVSELRFAQGIKRAKKK